MKRKLDEVDLELNRQLKQLKVSTSIRGLGEVSKNRRGVKRKAETIEYHNGYMEEQQAKRVCVQGKCYEEEPEEQLEEGQQQEEQYEQPLSLEEHWVEPTVQEEQLRSQRRA